MEGTEADFQATVVSLAKIADARTADARTTATAPVLVAVDFSAEAAAALIWACNYADSIAAPLEVLHVVHDPAGSPGAYKPDSEDQLEPMADIANRKLDRFVEDVGRDNPRLQGLATAKLLCIHGLPAPTILEVARVHQVRLLVLGGRQRNGIARLIHASTAQQVAGRAPLPVTIVKSGD